MLRSFAPLAAGAALAAGVLTPAPSLAATQCSTERGVEICLNPERGSYSVRNFRQPEMWIYGKCGDGGGANWGALSFPAAEEMHSLFCPGRALSPAI